ncbi:MAG: GntR family transcriptional regulator [Oscillospiraceae bacterium]|jgi:DNA-binding GntR family transcriptional regulator|nr:GntR family transcriptional regulator [Oscillospiraceae bacterium]
MAEPKVKTIRGQVYQILRDDICSGKYEPGFWLQEKELAEQLGVSRSPVREVLRQLVADGLVIEVPNKGVYVKEFTLRDIDEIFDMRVLLETYGIQRSKKNMTSVRRQKLFELLELLEKSCAAGDLDKYVQIDEELHIRIVELGGNSLVESTYDRVRSMNQQFRVLSLASRQRFSDSMEEHRRLIHALAVGDIASAEETVRIHLELARRTIKEQLMQGKMMEEN